MTIPKVVSGTFELPTGKVIEVGETAWVDWLDLPETRSFRFDDGVVGFTARKEKVKGQDGYWYAYASVLGKTRKKYLGKTESLTQEKMAEVERQLHGSDGLTQITQSALPNASPGNAKGKSASAVTFDVEGLKAEILAELRAELHRELGKTIAQTGEQRLASQAEIELADTQATADRLQAELDEVRSHLEEARSELADRQREIAELELELDEVRSQLTREPDYEALAAVALASLKLGKQAPGYKSARKAIAKFQELLR